jgi:hypothetical protein
MRATPADVVTISAVTFRSRLAELDLSALQFATRTGLGYSTVKAWGAWRTKAGTRQLRTFPAWVDLLLAAWEAHGVPDAPRPSVGMPAGSSPPRNALVAPHRPAVGQGAFSMITGRIR